MGTGLPREAFLPKLQRIVEAAEASAGGVEVEAIYLFGSFARGAALCRDVDLIVHARWPTSDRLFWEVDAHALLRARTALKGRMQRVDLSLTETFDPNEPIGWKGVEAEDLVFLWSVNDRDWRSKVDAIAVRPDAGHRHRPMDDLLDLKRTGSDLYVADELTDDLANGIVTVERISLEELSPTPELWPSSFRETWEQVASSERRVGAGLRRLWPHCAQWLVSEGCTELTVHTSSKFGGDPGALGQMGRIHLDLVRWGLEEGLSRVGLLPHLKSGGYWNGCLSFSRGPNWEERPGQSRVAVPDGEPPF